MGRLAGLSRRMPVTVLMVQLILLHMEAGVEGPPGMVTLSAEVQVRPVDFTLTVVDVLAYLPTLGFLKTWRKFLKK